MRGRLELLERRTAPRVAGSSAQRRLDELVPHLGGLVSSQQELDELVLRLSNVVVLRGALEHGDPTATEIDAYAAEIERLQGELARLLQRAADEDDRAA